MNTIAHADLFFIISTVGFVIFGVLLIVLLVALIKLVRKARILVKKADANMDMITDEAKDFFASLRESRIGAFILGRRKSKRSTIDK